MIFGLSLAFAISRLLQFYELLIFVYVLMSWFPINGGILLDIYRVLGSICEPFIAIFRRILPAGATGGAGLDFSPMVAILVLIVLQNIIAQLPF